MRKTLTAEEREAKFGQAPQEQHRKRLHFLLVAFVVLFTGIMLRLAQLQLNPRLELTEEEKMHFGQIILREPRGEIFDRNGLVLATNRDVPSLWVDPRAVSNRLETAMLLSTRLHLPEAEVLEKLEPLDKDGAVRKFVWLKRWIMDQPEEQLTELEELTDGAVQLQYEPLRTYPQGDTAAHLLGFVNRNGDASEGVELAFNKYLESIPGKKLARFDGRRRVLESQVMEFEEPKGGDLLQLTLDTSIQHSLEKALDQRMVECKAPRAMGILLDPYSGAILALACRPAFDPNHYDEYPPELRKNRALVDAFEPGSCFKIVTASAGLEHALITPNTIIDTHGGVWNPYGHTIKDFHKFQTPEPFYKCFEESSNIAMIKVGALLGEERLENWIHRFGFGAPTSHDFSLESRGIFRSRDKWSRLTMGSLPMGQEIMVTTLQLAKAYAVIANGGYAIEPYYVERAVSRYGEVTYQHEMKEKTRILSPEVARTMQQLCHQVVLHGTGEEASIPEYSVGGKTGTAQMALPGHRGYDPDRYTTVFAGFAPVSDPRLVAVIVVQEPMIRLHYGGPVCGPVFKEVVRNALVRLKVAPDQTPPAEKKKNSPSGNTNGLSLLAKLGPLPDTAEDAAPVAGPTLPAVPSDADTIVERLTPEEMDASMEAMLEPLDGMQLLTVAAANNKQGELPDLMGLSKREALAKLSEMGIPWDAQGVGWVVSQEPPAGTPLMNISLCALQFAPTQAPPADEQATTL